MTDASLIGANLTHVDLRETILNGADLSRADLTDALYEPAVGASPELFANARGLNSLRWEANSKPIFALRKTLIEAGFTGLAHQVTAAIHRHDESAAERVFFDWTCEWGANWLRPLVIAGVICVVCTFIYWRGMRREDPNSGLYLSATGERIVTAKGKQRILRITVYPSRLFDPSDQLELELTPEPDADVTTQHFREKIRWELRAPGTAFLFSLMSMFNIGFREFDFGRWIRMVQPREFDITARGWIRTVSGLQSLMGVALLALAILSYFGHPFD